MSRHLPPEPHLKTPREDWNAGEFVKENAGILVPRGDALADAVIDDAETGLPSEAETIAKSHGIYLEYNRAQTGRERDWMYMVRLSVPGGGAFNAEQWRVLDEVAQREDMTVPQLRDELRDG
ncbi:MAG: hypothetical protein AAGK78_04775, partial [Planctomycetota bacterium]